MLTLVLAAAAREAVADPAEERADAMAGNSMAGPPTDELVSTFARELPQLVGRDRVPGAAAALVHRGELVWEGQAGVVDRESNAAVGADTVFQVASLSKPVTALGVMLLVEEGRLDLDRPVWDYIDDWRPRRSRRSRRSERSGRSQRSVDASGVTARRLLSHRAGVSVHGYPGHAPDRPLPSLLESLDGQSGGAGPAALVVDPGSAVLYSSGGYEILELLIERIAGEPFARFMERRVLRPLGMNESSFEPPAEPAIGDRATEHAMERDPTITLDTTIATGHGWWGGALPAYRFREQAASGLYSTAGDVARFLAVLSDAEAQRAVGVSPATIAAMIEAPAGGGFTLGFALDAAAARDEDGVVVPGPRLVWHNGSNRGFRAILAAAPGSGDAFVVLTNSDRGLPMTDDLMCTWGRRLTGLETATCWVERKRRGTMVLLAGLAGLGAAMDGAAFVRRLRRRRAMQAVQAVPEADGATAADRHVRVRLALSLLLLAGWWIYWYTDRFALWREGIEHFVPVSAQPPTFFWLTVVLTGWCLLGVARFAASRRSVVVTAAEVRS